MVMVANKVMNQLDDPSDMSIEMFCTICQGYINRFPWLELYVETLDDSYILRTPFGNIPLEFRFDSDLIGKRWVIGCKEYVNFSKVRLNRALYELSENC